MARHLSLAAIGRGMSRRRAPRSRARWAGIVVLGLVALTGAGLAVPQIRGPIRSAVGIAGIDPADDPAQVGAPGCALGTTDLVVASSVDKGPLLTRFATEFSRTGRDAAGRCVHVHVVPKSSGAAMGDLAKGWPTEPKPDVWTPSGSIWLPLLEARLAEQQQSSLVPAPASAPSIAASPLVIAMPRPMAEAMGWPAAAIGWSDLWKLGTARTGWGAFGHPEWGPFQLGKTNPNFSHAGLEGTVAAYYAAVGRTTGLSTADVARPETRRFVAGVEQSIVRYGDNTLTYSADWRRADDAGQAMSYLSALVTEENLVAAYNEGNPGADPALAGRNPPPKVPLAAIYPKEGTFLADHPYAVLSGPWVTDAKRDAAAAFLAHLLSAPVQREFQAHHFRNARGQAGPETTPALGLLPAEPSKVLAPPAAATTAAILDSWSQLRKTANVITLMDVSGSMAEPAPGGATTRLEGAKQAVVGSLDLFTDQDAVGLWSFSGGRRGAKDWTELVPVGAMNAPVGARPRREAIRTSVTALRAQGDTGLYNSIGAAYDALQEAYEPQGINAIVVLTDGRNDAQSGLTLEQLLKRLTTDGAGRHVRVITIAYGPDADQATLARIARATGGASYVAQGPAEIQKAYAAALSNV